MISNSKRRHCFIADCMLGTLAKRLRLLGYDTLYFNQIDDKDIVAISEREERVILTRDTRLIKRRRARHYLLIESERLEDQIMEVIRKLEMKVDKSLLHSRCLICNSVLKGVDKKIVEGKVPSYIYRTQKIFLKCPKCGKFYWHGTHVKNMLDQITAEVVCEKK